MSKYKIIRWDFLVHSLGFLSFSMMILLGSIHMLSLKKISSEDVSSIDMIVFDDQFAGMISPVRRTSEKIWNMKRLRKMQFCIPTDLLQRHETFRSMRHRVWIRYPLSLWSYSCFLWRMWCWCVFCPIYAYIPDETKQRRVTDRQTHWRRQDTVSTLCVEVPNFRSHGTFQGVQWRKLSPNFTMSGKREHPKTKLPGTNHQFDDGFAHLREVGQRRKCPKKKAQEQKYMTSRPWYR